MTEFVPIALACGHVIQDWTTFNLEPGAPPEVECPEGCGWQRFVIEPNTAADNPPSDMDEYDEHSIIEYDDEAEDSHEVPS